MKPFLKLSMLLVLLFFLTFVDLARAAYDPTIGRWLSRDPIEESGGLNLYAYVGSNPIDRIDLLGLWPNSLTGNPTNAAITASIMGAGASPATPRLLQNLQSFAARGAGRLDGLSNATHQAIANVFSDNGFRIGPQFGHFVKRCKDSRIDDLGVKTFKDLEAILRNGTVSFSRWSASGNEYWTIDHGKVRMVFDATNQTMVTITPLH